MTYLQCLKSCRRAKKRSYDLYSGMQNHVKEGKKEAMTYLQCLKSCRRVEKRSYDLYSGGINHVGK